MSAFLRMLMSGRDREPNQAFQEKLAWYSLFRPHPARDVQAAPIRPPVKDKRDA